jgi:hypothetical protein
MSELDRCQNGSEECEFDHKHELILVGELMRLIGDYGTRENIGPCPLCLRDTVLAIAALLHIEAARIGQTASAGAPLSVKDLGHTLAEAVRERLESIVEAKAAIVSRSKN